jgi:hypothetical protein
VVKTQEAVRRRKKAPPSPNRRGPLIVGATLAVGILALLIGSRVTGARRDLDAARTELQTARQALSVRDDSGAKAALDRADARLTAARTRAEAFPLGLVKPLPLVGSLSRAPGDAARAGREAVAAGRILLSAGASLPTSDSGGINGQDLSGFRAAAVRSETALHDADAHLAAAAKVLAGPAGAALPMVSGPARSIRADVARSRHQLDGAQRGLALLAELTGPETDARLLLLSQDSLELRPAGGYIGSYGVVHFFHGSVTLEKYEATEALPPPDPPMDPPEGLADSLPGGMWRLSNVNWWPDFPTTAMSAREMYKRQGGVEVDGVLALTEYATARLVGALGPLAVPGYDKAVTEDGFDKRVVYEVEQKRPLDEPRKKFLTELANVLFDRVFHLSGGQLPKVAGAIDRSTAAGDIQLWFADPARQHLIDGAVVAGRLPATTSDFLMLVDANLAASKANLGLTKQVDYRVRRISGGRLQAHLEVKVTNKAPESDLNPYYDGYLRVYVPLGSRLLGHVEGQGSAGPAEDGAYDLFTQQLTVEPDGEQVANFDYVLPTTVTSDGRYRLTWPGQVGTGRDARRAMIDGHPVQAVPDDRTFVVDRTVNDTGPVAWLRRRWVVRRLGL